jgi:hypothetical protein
LAVEAAKIADTFDLLAAHHEHLAGEPRHPLSPGAAEHAAMERVMALKEREASLWFQSIADREA